MSHRSQSGRATGSIVLLLLVASGAGGWNYHRNWQVEQQMKGTRPYASYEVEDLEALRDAYHTELAGVRVEFDQAKSRRARSHSDVGSISGNVEQFQRATRTSSAIRAAAGGVAERESEITALDRELELRSRFGQGLERHIKRLTTI